MTDILLTRHSNQIEPYSHFASEFCVDSIALSKARKDAYSKIPQKNFEMWECLKAPLKNMQCSALDVSSRSITIGASSNLKRSQHLDLQYILKFFIPWKKGPFKIFGHSIEAEWDSHLKWERISSHISSLKDKTIADIGCHNGYYMLRMLEGDPNSVVGFDPVYKLFCAFSFFQHFFKSSKLFYELLGVEVFKHYSDLFDMVFCLGILYHHRDPIGILKNINQSLKRKGEVIIDCQGVDMEGSYALFPSHKYAGAKGVHFIPTLECLFNWLQKAQFVDIKCFYKAPLTTEEQRATPWAPISSFKDFLDPKDYSFTKEGYLAPWRFYLKARKK